MLCWKRARVKNTLRKRTIKLLNDKINKLKKLHSIYLLGCRFSIDKIKPDRQAHWIGPSSKLSSFARGNWRWFHRINWPIISCQGIWLFSLRHRMFQPELVLCWMKHCCSSRNQSLWLITNLCQFTRPETPTGGSIFKRLSLVDGYFRDSFFFTFLRRLNQYLFVGLVGLTYGWVIPCVQIDFFIGRVA